MNFMKKFLPLFLLLVLPLGLVSCEEDQPWEEEMMGEYWSDDANSVLFVLKPNKTGFVEYGDGTGFNFTWWASKTHIHFTVDMPGYPSESFRCEYRWRRDGELVIYDFDRWGDLYLFPRYFYYETQQQALPAE